jgi:hypothetical protein
MIDREAFIARQSHQFLLLLLLMLVETAMLLL